MANVDEVMNIAKQTREGLETALAANKVNDRPWDQPHAELSVNEVISSVGQIIQWIQTVRDKIPTIPLPREGEGVITFAVRLIGDLVKGAFKIPETLSQAFKNLLDRVVAALKSIGIDIAVPVPDPKPVDPNNHVDEICEGLLFKDVDKRNNDELQRLKDRRFQLEQRLRADGALPVLLDHELKWIYQRAGRDARKELENNKIVDIPALPSWNVVDPLFKVLQSELLTKLPVSDHNQGVFDPSPIDDAGADVREFVALYGILLRDRMVIPSLDDFYRDFPSNSEEEFQDAVDAFTDKEKGVSGDPKVIAKYLRKFVEQRFYSALATARGEYSGYRDLYQNVLKILAKEGTKLGSACSILFAERWAAILRSLIRDNISADDPYLQRRVLGALGDLVTGNDATPPSSIEIDLPDLEKQSDVEILSENVKAMQAIYFAGTLEELKLFQVRDKLTELFQIGMLPIIRGRAGDLIYQQMKRSVTRLSEYERRNLYARTLGMAGGDSGGGPNRDFPILWLRFVSAVSSFARRMSLDSLLRANIPARVQQEQVRKSGRDLAANLSLYGYGMAYFAATELQNEINEIIELLSTPEILNAYGARDMWGVIDQVASLELGGARDSVRYRTMASAGGIIIGWLASHGPQLAAVGGGNILDENEIARPNIRPAGSKVTKDPFDSDLVNACERWLAVTGTGDTLIEQYAEPVESPMTTSRPIQIPSAARDLLDSVGIKANGMGR